MEFILLLLLIREKITFVRSVEFFLIYDDLMEKVVCTIKQNGLYVLQFYLLTYVLSIYYVSRSWQQKLTPRNIEKVIFIL